MAAEIKEETKMDTTDEKTEEKTNEVNKEETANGDEEGAPKKEGEEEVPEKKGFKYRDGSNATADEHANSPYLRIRNKTLMNALTDSLEKTQVALKEIFVDKLEVGIPKVKLPLMMHLYVEMASLEDKFKVMSNTPRPERWSSNRRPLPVPEVVTQSVVARSETIGETVKGTLEEALEELLPSRNMLYKDQLDVKFKQLDETVEKSVEVTKQVLSKDKRYKKKEYTLDKPKVDSIVPMIPNVGYDRNVVLDLEKDATGKIIPGIRVLYTKDEVKKSFLLPVSECSHIAPQIVKAATELCAKLTAEKFTVFDGVNQDTDIYTLKFTMNDIGEIIVSAVLVLNDSFDEFYDLMDTDNLAKEVTDYFDTIKTKGKEHIIKEAKENGEDVAEEDGDEEAAAEEDEEKTDKAKTETKDDAAKPASEEPKEDEKKGEETKAPEEEDDDDITILRENTKREVKLKNSQLLSRMDPVIRNQLARLTPVLKSFFDEKAAALGVTGIFVTWYVTSKRPTDWGRNLKHWYHVCGNQMVIETANNVKLELYPFLETLHPARVQAVPTIMNLLTDALGIDANSRAVVACDYHLVQNFFAQKCKKTLLLSFVNEGLKTDVRQKFKEGVMYVSAKARNVSLVDKCTRFFGDLPNIIIHWGPFREQPLKRLFQYRVAKVAVIFDPQENITFRNQGDTAEVLRKLNCILHPQYIVKRVIGIDVGPLKNSPPAVVVIYESVPGVIPSDRGLKRKGGPMYGLNKRPMMQGKGNDRFGDRRRGGGGGGAGGGGYGKRPRIDDSRRPQPLLSSRGGGNNRSRFNQRPPHPWNDSRRFEPYNGRGGGFNNQGQQEPTVQAAKAVLSQLNSIIENQLMLAQIKSGPDQTQRGRPDESWVGGGRRENYGSNRDGPSNFANDQDYFSRDRSPPSYGGGGGGNRNFDNNRGYGDNSGRNYGGGGGGNNANRNYGGGDSGRGFGGGDNTNRRVGGGIGGGGGGGMNNRRNNMGGGGGGMGGGAGNKPYRFNNRRN